MGIVRILKGLLEVGKLKGMDDDIMIIKGLHETIAKLFMPFGFAHNPPKDSTVLIFSIGGLSFKLGIASNTAKKPLLGTGDIAIYDNHGHSITLIPIGINITGNVSVGGTMAISISLSVPTITASGITTGGLTASSISVGGASIPLPGASGGFISKDDKSVTVVNGIITSIT